MRKPLHTWNTFGARSVRKSSQKFAIFRDFCPVFIVFAPLKATKKGALHTANRLLMNTLRIL